MRLQLPHVSGESATGYWPAGWALGSRIRANLWDWPAVGEIDLVERANAANSIVSTLHCGSKSGGPCNETTGLGRQTFCGDCDTAFHKYRFELDRSVLPNEIRWFFDDRLVQSVNSDQVGKPTFDEATAGGFFLILDVPIAGAFPPSPPPPPPLP